MVAIIIWYFPRVRLSETILTLVGIHRMSGLLSGDCHHVRA
jgi:hypothetical protein